MQWAGVDLHRERDFWFWDEKENAMKSIRYKGPMESVTLSTGELLVRGGEPVPVPDETAAELLSNRPDEFDAGKAVKKSATRGK